MARWQLSASTVTIVSFRDSIASNFGTAVISFDFSAQAVCPSDRPYSLAHTLTECNAPSPLSWS